MSAPARQPSPPRTLLDLLEGASAVAERGIRLVDRREHERFLPWRRIAAAARRTGAGLAAAGVRPGDRVALIHPTGQGLLEALFGTYAAGAVPGPRSR
ncbi:MAG: AMP-binding protein [Thermoanaerobaculia bacterium]